MRSALDTQATDTGTVRYESTRNIHTMPYRYIQYGELRKNIQWYIWQNWRDEMTSWTINHKHCYIWDVISRPFLTSKFDYTRTYVDVITSLWHILKFGLTHLHLDKMTTISKKSFSSTFSWMKNLELWLKLHRSLLLRVQLTIIQHFFT